MCQILVCFQLLLKIIFNYSQMKKITKITPHINVQVDCKQLETRILTGSEGDNFQHTFMATVDAPWDCFVFKMKTY